MKLCINCRWCHFESHGAHDYYECGAPQNFTETTSPVTGVRSKIPTLNFCDSQRASDLGNVCGSKGRWFEPKDSDEHLVAEAQKDEAA